MMTLDDRAGALEPFGFSPRQARFLAMAALHSGYCLRRQYAAYAGVRYGKNVRDFLDSLVDRRLAERFTVRADRGHVYHVCSRTVYRALGQEDNRNRREASAAAIARKVMLLDFVLAHSDVEWLATEADKLDLFADRFDVPRPDLPQRAYASSRPEGGPTVRFFPHKLPVAVVGDPPIAQFVYSAAEHVGGGFDAFLQDHAGLFGHLAAWTVLVIGPPGLPALTTCEAAFERFLAKPTVGLVLRSDDLRWYVTTRKAVDAGELARLSVTDINRFRALREKFRGPAFDAVYRDWLQRGDTVLAGPDRASHAPRRSVGRLVVETLRFDYSQFGSLPGVA
ncbi:MAG: hypothetical protein IT180_06545 [Acidobacteria bacterium]|nr:hypothetical protein [Acidobacteriota bacterium]